ncbi:FCG2C protein, partial [Polypterus senegalus]|nr:FCG2C protein [Polypterus senegalus]
MQIQKMISSGFGPSTLKLLSNERTTKLEVKSKNINGEVYESEQVSLHCGVDGDPDGWTYELYKTGDRNPYTTQMENIFTISSVNITHSGEYWCRAGKEKLYSKASDPVQLQVSALNVTLSASPRRYVKVKDFLNLNCTWGGNQSSVSTLKFSFLRNNVTVKNSSDSTLFSIKQFNASQTGKYKCAVETPGGGKAYSNEIEIVMKESPLAIILASVGFGLFILVVLLLFVYHRTRAIIPTLLNVVYIIMSPISTKTMIQINRTDSTRAPSDYEMGRAGFK